MKAPEILAPAGDMEKLKFAVLFGADAVYLGLNAFSMRTSTKNFDKNELKSAVNFAHTYNVKVYLTCNTLPHNTHLNKLPEFFEAAATAKVDALIISDIGVLAYAKKVVPNIDIHISTQAGVVNFAAANEFYKLGAKRIILARELNLEEIKQIRENTPKDLELEAFVHGAMCMAFSGRCLLSSFLTGRSANTGECVQPCRWNYYLMESKRPGEYYKLCESKVGNYILNSKDLCMLEHLDELIEAGIDSFKIEGRSKSFYYAAMITNAYKQALNHIQKNGIKQFKLPENLLKEVEKVSHRQYCTGFYFGNPQNGQYYENSGYIRNYNVLATIDYCKNGFVYCTQRNKFYSNIEAEILEPQKTTRNITIGQLYNKEGCELECVNHPMMKFNFKSDEEFRKNSIIIAKT